MSLHAFRSTLAGMLVGVSLLAAPAAQQRDPRQYQQTLENPDRVAALQVDRVVSTLAITPGMRIADLGAGSGIFTVPFAKAAGPTGKVYGIDVDAGLLAIVAEKAKAAGVTTVETIVAGATDPKLPEPVDLLFICDTMHHLPNQADYVKQFGKLLRPGGRVVVIDFAEGKWPAGHEAFTITPTQVDAWMQAAGFTRSGTHTFLATNFFHVYQGTIKTPGLRWVNPLTMRRFVSLNPQLRERQTDGQRSHRESDRDRRDRRLAGHRDR